MTTDSKSDVINNIVHFFLILYHWIVGIILTLVPRSIRYKDVKDQTVLITGGGSGLGRALACRFAGLGCRIVIWDINAAGMSETAARVKKIGATVFTFQVDISDRQAVYETAARTKQIAGPISMVINNAGIVTGKRFIDLKDEDIDKTMAVNCTSNFWIIKSFLPDMMKVNKGHIVTISSVAGLSGGPRLADYCASKFGSCGIDESLRYEMKTEGYDGIHCTVVCPWFINTGMFDGVKTKYMGLLEQDYVADEIVSGILVNQEIIVVPRLIYFLLFIKSFLPTQSSYYIIKLIGGDTAMMTFHGRHNKVKQG